MTPKGINIALSILIIVFNLLILPGILKFLFKKISNMQQGMILLAYVIAAAVTTGLIFG